MFISNYYSAAEIGAICSALELTYSSSSPEILHLEHCLLSDVRQYLGDHLYDAFLEEFHLTDV